jgi:tetratricopeptide (TPR) repeat protein
VAAGTVDARVHTALRALEDQSSALDEKLRLAESALAVAPECARLHLEHGKCLSALGRESEALAAYRRGLAANPDSDTRSWLLVRLGHSLAPAERRSLLAEAVALQADGGNLVAAAMASLLLRTTSSDGQ